MEIADLIQAMSEVRESGKGRNESQKIDIYKDKGTFYQLQIFEPDAEKDREFSAKGDEVIIYHPDDERQMWKYHPKKGAAFQIPAGYAARVVMVWVVWAE